MGRAAVIFLVPGNSSAPCGGTWVAFCTGSGGTGSPGGGEQQAAGLCFLQTPSSAEKWEETGWRKRVGSRNLCCLPRGLPAAPSSPRRFLPSLCQEMQPAGLSAVGDAGAAAARGHGGFVWCWRPNPRALEQRQRAGADHEPCRSPQRPPAPLQAWAALKLHDGAAEGESRLLVPSSCLDTSLISAGCFGWNKTLHV